MFRPCFKKNGTGTWTGSKDGVVCGIFKGYAVSMWEGLSGTKTFSISAKFDDKLYEKLDKDFSELEYKRQDDFGIRFMELIL